MLECCRSATVAVSRSAFMSLNMPILVEVTSDSPVNIAGAHVLGRTWAGGKVRSRERVEAFQHAHALTMTVHRTKVCMCVTGVVFQSQVCPALSQHL